MKEEKLSSFHESFTDIIRYHKNNKKQGGIS
jgi:hypothetical protein